MIRNFTMYLVLMLFVLVCMTLSENIWQYLIIVFTGVGVAGLMTYLDYRDASDKDAFMNQ